ncbi:MAG: redox-sensing transcriptional repressor Rex [Dehalococcoidia bacterium]|nr:redox-sensing transcriptional repressor Rex [Dehalococcoidia bacterium]MSQ17071.1 redox-sensing transcriptional repressor Rex [Dehalococcoidia bacterium]
MADDAKSPLDRPGQVPEVAVSRLPQYVRALSQLLADRVEVVNSQQLGEMLQITSPQIRKDLSYFGRFGKQGRGYSVRHLLVELQGILGLDHGWNVAVVGVGRRGRAILSYPWFTPAGFRLVAAFDGDPETVGQQVGELTVRPIEELDWAVRELQVRIAIVAVPSNQTQQVIDRLVGCGVRALLNYAPVMPLVRKGVRVQNIDPVLALQSMTCYLASEGLGPD